MRTLLLTAADVRSILTMEDAVPAVEAAFAAHGRGETSMPVKVYLDLPQYNGDFRAMPALLDGSAGVKWINAHPDNPALHGLPTVRGLYVLSDPITADPLAVMDATWFTGVRTGASAGVASKYLARPDARTAGFIGSGVQARSLLAALRVVFPDLDVVTADREPAAATSLAREVGGRLGSVEEAAGCDIVTTATPARSPVVERGWIRPGTHINAMGADGPGKQELDPTILQAAKVVVDDYHQASEAGEINVALGAGELDRGALHASLGEIVAGLAAGRENDEEVTVFDSTGLAIQDVAIARLVYEAANRSGIGTEIDFHG